MNDIETTKQVSPLTNSELGREALLLKVLRKSPVLSMYHTADGLDMEGFISAYETWKSSVRETLEQCDAAQGPSTKFIHVWKRYMPAPTPREANLYSWCERFWNEGRRAALCSSSQVPDGRNEVSTEAQPPADPEELGPEECTAEEATKIAESVGYGLTREGWMQINAWDLAAIIDAARRAIVRAAAEIGKQKE